MGIRWVPGLAALVLAAGCVGVADAAPPVANTNDSGSGSLRAAISGANPGDTITVPPGTITLTSGALTINKSLTIVGSGEGQTTISGNGQTQQIFSITSAPVILQALTLTGGGNATFGGAIDTTGDLTLDHVAVTNSTSVTFGGGVFAGRHRTRTITVTVTLGKASFALASGTNRTLSVHVGKLVKTTSAHAQIRRSDGRRSASFLLTLLVPEPKKHRAHH